MDDIGSKLREVRLRQGMSQEKLSIASGVDQATISRIENGKQSLLSDLAQQLANGLRVDTAEMLGLSLSPPRDAIKTRNLPVLAAKEAYKLRDSNVRLEQLKPIDTTPSSGDHSVKSFAVRIEDDSMEPEFKQGHTIVVDPAKLDEIRPGSYVVAATKYKTAVFMQYKLVGYTDEGIAHFQLHPLNNSYPALDSLRDDLVLLGLAVEHTRSI